MKSTAVPLIALAHRHFIYHSEGVEEYLPDQKGSFYRSDLPLMPRRLQRRKGQDSSHRDESSTNRENRVVTTRTIS